MLYRKYRPKNFSEVISQNHIKITLQNQIKTGKLGHAYLFCGPRAVGKTTLSRIIAKTINCKELKNKINDACNNCSVCREINQNAGLDIIEIDAASHTGVDNVRENIINMSQVAPANYKYKVFIIDEVHMLSTQAFNALLKTLEEPPSYIVFILCTTEVHKIPLTIISRCQRFNFKKIGVSDITKKLEIIAMQEKIKIEKNVLESIALQSGGHMRDAESLLNQVLAIGYSQENEEITMEKANLVIPRSDLDEVITLIEYLFQKNISKAIKLINKLVDEGIDLKLFSSELIEVLRKIMLAKSNQDLAQKLSLELGENHEKKISEISKNINVNELINIIKKFNTAKNELNKYPLPQLALELGIIELITHNTQHATHNTQHSGVEKSNNNQPTTKPLSNQTIEQSNQPITQKINIQPPANATIPPSSNLTIELINAKWKELLSSIQKTNPSVSFILRACQPQSVNNNQLTLAFKYKFHQDQIERPEIKSLMTELLQKIYAQSITINTILDSNLSITNTSPAKNSVQDIPPAQPNPSINNNVTTNNANNDNTNNNEMMNDILNTFGGRVIN